MAVEDSVPMALTTPKPQAEVTILGDISLFESEYLVGILQSDFSVSLSANPGADLDGNIVTAVKLAFQVPDLQDAPRRIIQLPRWGELRDLLLEMKRRRGRWAVRFELAFSCGGTSKSFTLDSTGADPLWSGLSRLTEAMYTNETKEGPGANAVYRFDPAEDRWKRL